jgi:glycerol-3-phosphate acyltransferase PlsY
MDTIPALLSGVLGYLVGSISSARIVGRLAAPQVDLTKTEFGIAGSEDKVESGLVSATAISIHAGPRLGFVTMLLDMLKIALPTLLVRRAYAGANHYLLTAAAGMVGHMWPLYHGFKGGRGMSAVYGGMFAIDWIGVFATSLGGMLFGLFIVRDFLVAYMAGFWFLIPWLWFRTHDVEHLLYAVAVNVVLLVGMVPEVRQYLRLRKEGKGGDLSEVMQLTAMGRGMYKIAARFGLLRAQPMENDERTKEDE